MRLPVEKDDQLTKTTNTANHMASYALFSQQNRLLVNNIIVAGFTNCNCFMII